jgi:hypothetical protein
MIVNTVCSLSTMVAVAMAVSVAMTISMTVTVTVSMAVVSVSSVSMAVISSVVAISVSVSVSVSMTIVSMAVVSISISISISNSISFPLVQPGDGLEGMAAGMVLADSIVGLAVVVAVVRAQGIAMAVHTEAVVGVSVSTPLAIVEAMDTQALGRPGHEGSGVASMVSEC